MTPKALPSDRQQRAELHTIAAEFLSRHEATLRECSRQVAECEQLVSNLDWPADKWPWSNLEWTMFVRNLENVAKADLPLQLMPYIDQVVVQSARAHFSSLQDAKRLPIGRDTSWDRSSQTGNTWGFICGIMPGLIVVGHGSASESKNIPDSSTPTSSAPTYHWFAFRGETLQAAVHSWVAIVSAVSALLDPVRELRDKLASSAASEITTSKYCKESACELADGQLFIKGDRPRRLLAPEWAVLEAIAKHGALELDELHRKSSVDDSHKVLRTLGEKYPALQVDLPGGKSRGGYWANVKLRRAPKA